VDGGVAQFRRSQSFIDVKYYLMAIQNQRQSDAALRCRRLPSAETSGKNK